MSKPPTSVNVKGVNASTTTATKVKARASSKSNATAVSSMETPATTGSPAAAGERRLGAWVEGRGGSSNAAGWETIPPGAVPTGSLEDDAHAEGVESRERKLQGPIPEVNPDAAGDLNGASGGPSGDGAPGVRETKASKISLTSAGEKGRMVVGRGGVPVGGNSKDNVEEVDGVCLVRRSSHPRKVRSETASWTRGVDATLASQRGGRGSSSRGMSRSRSRSTSANLSLSVNQRIPASPLFVSAEAAVLESSSCLSPGVVGASTDGIPAAPSSMMGKEREMAKNRQEKRAGAVGGGGGLRKPTTLDELMDCLVEYRDADGK